MSKHTPGPWRACGDAKCECRQVWSIPGDCPVFTARDVRGELALVGAAHQKWGDGPDMIYGEIPSEQTEANARLIAAAPELFAALEELLSADPDMPSFQETVQRAESAIAKAEGRE